MKKILFLVFIAIFDISSAFAYTEADLFRDMRGCDTYKKKPTETNGYAKIEGGPLVLDDQTIDTSIYGISVTLNCQYPNLSIKCDSSFNIPQCEGKKGEFVNIDKNELMSRLLDSEAENIVNSYMDQKKGENINFTDELKQKLKNKAKENLNNKYNYDYPYTSSTSTSTKPAQTTPPDAGKILDDKTESGKKTDLSSQSVTGSTKQPTIDGTAAMQNETGKTTSGNVEKSSFVGASNLGDDYGMGDCAGGNIFQQLACRAGVIGSGLKTVGYMIAGFGLIVFSFAAIFGKVKWPLFATIMFSCFLLSATVFVVNMMTDKGDASWIGGIKGNGSSYYSDNVTNVPATDSGGVPDGESPK